MKPFLCALVCLVFAFVGCSGPITGGTLVTTIPDTESQVQVAADFWNQHGGDWRVSTGACTHKPCVYIVLGDCAETKPVSPGQYKACVPHSGAERIEVQELLMANRESLDLALVFAHEIGHIMGHGHTGPGTVMSLKSGESAWVAP